MIACQVLARSTDRLPNEGITDEEEDHVDIDLSDSDMDVPQPKQKSTGTKGNLDAKSFKPNLGAFAGDEDDELFSDEDEELSDDDEEQEFTGFSAMQAEEESDHDDGSDEEDEEVEGDDEDDDMVVPEPSLPSDAEFDSDDDETNNQVDLQDLVNSLNSGKKRKVAFDEVENKDSADVNDDTAGKKKRRVLPSMQGPGGREEGGDFGLNPSEFKLSLLCIEVKLK